MTNTNIEVEVRAFVTKKEYERLLGFFRKSSKFVKEDNQETIYYDCEEDLRIQKNNFTSKIWLKGGRLHDDFREETEIHMERSNYNKLQILFRRLGYKQEIKWIRDRKEFNWNGIVVCLDYTIGYGYILELEMMSSKKDKDKKLEILRKELRNLRIKETPKEDFDKAYQDYKKNWKKIIKNRQSS